VRTIIAGFATAAILGAAQAPTIQNGTIDPRAGAPAAEIAAARASAARWLGWRVPLVAGDRDLCASWTTDRDRVRGIVLDVPTVETRPSAPSQPARTFSLNAGTTLLVLVRATDGRVERIRTIADDCPIDAHGQTLHWLTAVSPADSVSFLESLTAAGDLGPSAPAVRDSAIAAIALHADATADAALDRLTRPGLSSAIRTGAARWLVNARGEPGFDRVSALIASERDSRLRATFVAALARGSSPRTGAALLDLARSDADPTVRGEAISGYARLGGGNIIETLAGLLGRESQADVRARIVAAFGLVPGEAGIPRLLEMASREPDPLLRKEAVRALSRSTDPRATRYLEGVLRN
jgi:HEAT repeat protein